MTKQRLLEIIDEEIQHAKWGLSTKKSRVRMKRKFVKSFVEKFLQFSLIYLKNEKLGEHNGTIN